MFQNLYWFLAHVSSSMLLSHLFHSLHQPTSPHHMTLIKFSAYLGMSHFEGPVRSGLSETTYCRLLLPFLNQLLHLLLIGGGFILRGQFGPVCQRRPTVETSSPTFSTRTTFITTAPPFSDKDFILTGTRTHSSLLASLMP